MKKKTDSIAVIIAVVSSLVFLMTGHSHGGDTHGVKDNIVKVGLIMDQTGPAASVTVGLTQAIRSLVRHANENGGICGRKIKLIVEDDRYNIPAAISAFKKLFYKDKVAVLMGPSGSSALNALMGKIEKEKIPLISTSMPEIAVNPFKRYVFTVADIYPNQMNVLVDYIFKDLKAEKPRIAVVYPDNRTGKVDLRSTLKRLRLYQVEPVAKKVLNPGAVDASSQIMSLKRVNPDHIILPGGSPQPTIVFLRDLKKYGLSVPVFGSFATCAEEVIEMTGQASRNWYSVSCLSSWYDAGPGVARMRKITLQHHPRTEKPYRGKLYTHGWVMGTVMIEGLKRAGRNLNREAYIDALECIRNLDTGGITGPISYSSKSHKGGDSWKIFKADPDTGKFIPLTGWRKSK